MQLSILAAAAALLASVLAAPALPIGGVATGAVASVPAVGELVSIVHTLKAEVEVELAAIGALAVGDIKGAELELSLIVGKVENITSKVDTLVAGLLPVGVGAADLQLVVGLVEEVKGLLDEVESSVAALTATLAADVLTLLNPKLAALQAVLGPLVTPVLALAFSVVGSVKGDATGLVGKLLLTANGLKAVLPSLLGSALGGIL